MILAIVSISLLVTRTFFADNSDVRSYIPSLSSVVKLGITTLIWSGDADFICNWFGNLEVVNALTWQNSIAFKNLEVSNYTVNGTVGGTFKTLDNLSWLRVFGAGHEVPLYRKSCLWKLIERGLIVKQSRS